MEDVKQIVSAINKGDIKPIYFLMGEEAYYIDKISDFIENNVLDESEKGFNQMVLYGRDVTIDEIESNAKRYPMMAERQVVIVKEAQDLSRTIEKLAQYAANPQPSTVLVLNYKYKKLDKRKALYKAIKKVGGVVFESKTMYENQVADWIRRVLAGQNYNISPKASQMLVEFLGTDLGKIDNELSKLKIVLPEGTQITPDHIEENIGISKDYNNFELRKAIGERNVVKAHRIAKYFGENPKDNPFVFTVYSLFSFFSQLLQLHGMTDRNPRSIASAIKVHPYFVTEYLDAAKNFPMKKVSYIIGVLREYDVKGKGVGANATPEGDLLKELLVKILG
ncbi:DNA polymerase III subunit delta [Winogradskyella eckloniae]|uniref:DNA polymerase III subunit delta n=1 Tax=Winogradskyella eckloniae TaxID=1089306 RepID=UPI001564B58D|nr:DNA polymerase III subunit delta [Winogradskyella eckloniae]NRD19971.1 DNA polymerase III subunit delta [Winogradskyella eckloniae]